MGQALNDFIAGSSQRVYEGGRVDASQFKAARWDLLPQAGYLWRLCKPSAGVRKHCSFLLRMADRRQKPRQRASDPVIEEIVDCAGAGTGSSRSPDPVIEEIVDLRRRGYRFIALADDNFLSSVPD